MTCITFSSFHGPEIRVNSSISEVVGCNETQRNVENRTKESHQTQLTRNVVPATPDPSLAVHEQGMVASHRSSDKLGPFTQTNRSRCDLQRCLLGDDPVRVGAEGQSGGFAEELCISADCILGSPSHSMTKVKAAHYRAPWRNLQRGRLEDG